VDRQEAKGQSRHKEDKPDLGRWHKEEDELDLAQLQVATDVTTMAEVFALCAGRGCPLLSSSREAQITHHTAMMGATARSCARTPTHSLQKTQVLKIMALECRYAQSG